MTPSLTHHSLRRRLLLLLLASIALFATVQGVGAYRGALQQADAMFDYHLQQMAHSMRSGYLRQLPPGVDADDDVDFLVQIWGPDGVRLFRSPRSLLPQSAVLGFSDLTVQGNAYRVYTVQTPLQTVQIAQDMSARNARARALAVRAVLPVALLAPLLMLVVGWVVTHSLAPVERTRRQVAARAADDLSPLAEAGLPDEVRPLVQELNGLFGRVRSAFEAQQNFVADAAHELRSPLAALKLQAQALRPRADASPPEPAAQEAAVARLNQGIDRAIRMVEQLLALARAEGTAQPGRTTVLDLQQAVRLAVGDALPLAQASGIDLGLAPGAMTDPLPVHGDAEALRMLLRNLIENAIKYTPAPGQVDVGLRRDAQAAVLTVEDSGPGVAVEDRERVFDRFYRAPDAAGRSPSGGSGLGLAIVRAIAQQHGARVTLGSSARLGGLEVQVRFLPDPSAHPV
ncbi:MAG: sensor histidine kinase N-terminal domain-containing protein [Ramlibacter sp.]|nr:sensor histidine kinase N-terminal domain-containing protein [Ramlibacter sp.]